MEARVIGLHIVRIGKTYHDHVLDPDLDLDRDLEIVRVPDREQEEAFLWLASTLAHLLVVIRILSNTALAQHQDVPEEAVAETACTKAANVAQMDQHHLVACEAEVEGIPPTLMNLVVEPTMHINVVREREPREQKDVSQPHLHGL